MMEATGILLSICIPTYNRAELLRQTLATLTSQAVFAQQHEIEIIISDNASADHTTAVAAEFIEAFPGKILYHRHPETILPDLNFEAALKMGRGLYLKLHNDNLMVRDGALDEILKVIRATAAERPVITFTNGNQNQGNAIEVLANMDQFVTRVSFFSTWMGGFGIWREEFAAMDNFVRYPELKLIHTDVLFRLLARGKRAIVLFDIYFVGQEVGKKGGYNIAEVFGRNYLGLLKEYVQAGLLSETVFQQEKQLILMRHILPYHFDASNGFDKNGFFEYMQDYADDTYFYQALEQLGVDLHGKPIAASAPTPVAPPASVPAPDQVDRQLAHQQALAAQWRALNPHNETELQQAKGLFQLDQLSVGRRSYGGLTLWTFGAPGESLRIGSFVSIADDVKFLLGGNHDYHGISTFPFQTKYFATLEARSKGAIVIGDDVWIGYNSTILSGVSIGQGAIVAAGSTVTADVAPYSIVGGNPARVRKFRFAPEIIAKLGRLDYARVSDAAILRSRELLATPLTADNVDAFIDALMDLSPSA